MAKVPPEFRSPNLVYTATYSENSTKIDCFFQFLLINLLLFQNSGTNNQGLIFASKIETVLPQGPVTFPNSNAFFLSNYVSNFLSYDG